MGKLGVREKKFVKLGERDFAVLRWVSEQKFASLEQIQRKFWPGQNAKEPEKVCYRRLCQLVKFGHLERRCVPVEKLYQVGKLGLQVLRERGEEVLPYLEAIDLKNYKHDLCVNEVRITLEELGAHNWRSDRRIRQEKPRPHTPDAVFDIGDGNRVALELELTAKSMERYPAINQEYEDHFQDVSAILYLCGSEGVAKAVKSKLGQDPYHYYGIWDDFEKQRADTRFASFWQASTLREMS